jgi:hypothetical protein
MAFKMKGSPMARNYGAPFKKHKPGHTEPTAEEMAKSAIDTNKSGVSRAEGRVEKKWTEGDRASSDPTGSKRKGSNEDLDSFVRQGQLTSEDASKVRSTKAQAAAGAKAKRERLNTEKKEAVSKVSSPTSNLLDNLDKSNRPKELTESQKRAAAYTANKAKNSKKGKKGKK